MAVAIVWEGFQAGCHVKSFYDKGREELVHRRTHVADTSNKEQLTLLQTQCHSLNAPFHYYLFTLKKSIYSMYSNKWHHSNKHNVCVINSRAHMAHRQLQQIVFSQLS